MSREGGLQMQIEGGRAAHAQIEGVERVQVCSARSLDLLCLNPLRWEAVNGDEHANELES